MSRIEEIKKKLRLSEITEEIYWEKDIEWLLSEIERWKKGHEYLNLALSEADKREDKLRSTIIVLNKKLEKAGEL